MRIQNPYAVNVYRTGNEKIQPLRISKQKNAEPINLLLISMIQTNHYCWIKNISRLLTAQITKHNGKREFCHRCCNSFTTKKALEKHDKFCVNHEAIESEMPVDKDGKPMNIIFKNYNRKMRVTFVIYADFECYTEPIAGCTPNDDKSYTNKYQKHKPSGFSYLIKCSDDRVYPPKHITYTAKSPDEDISKLFVESLEANIKYIYNRFKWSKPIYMTTEDKAAYNSAKHCHICEESITQERISYNGKATHKACGIPDKDTSNVNWKEFYNTKECSICHESLDKVKVRDHCHLTGEYRGAAHNSCNLNYKIPKFFPVLFHNLAGYDSHLFIKNLGVSKGKINCIPNNEEKYISFTKQIVVDSFTSKGKQVEVKRDIRFLDSFKFMASGLVNLAANTTNFGNCDSSPCQTPKDDRLRITKLYYEGEQLKLLLRKGVFPYDWFNSFEKLNATQLPPIETFYSKLNDNHITEADYKHAKEVWKIYST